MKKSATAAALFASSMLFAVSANAATTVDVDTESVDNWQVTAPSTPIQAAVEVTSPNNAWTSLPANLKWLSTVPGGNTSVPNETYEFIYTLDSAGFFNTLSGIYFADNQLFDIAINGTSLGSLFTPNSNTEQFRGQFTLAPIQIDRSVETISFFVRNTTGNPSPMAFAGDFVLSVPEPGTWMLMILGLGAVGFAMRRRQRVSARFQFA